VNVIRTHPLSLHVQQFLEVLYLSLKLADHLHVLPIELHRFHFHHDLHSNKSTCLARSTNFSVFMVSSMFLREGEMLPTIKVKVFPVSES